MSDKKYTFPLRGHEKLRLHRESFKGEIYFLTFRKFHQAQTLDDPLCFEVIDGVLTGLEEDSMLHWFAFVLMPDHVHLVIRLGDRSLDQVAKRVKGTSAYQINKLRGSSGKLWDSGYYDHVLRKKEPLGASVYYVMMNPVRKGLASSPKEWLYSRARWDEIGPIL